MSKRTRKDSGEERVTAKSKPMMKLVSRFSERTPVVLPSTAYCIRRPGKTRHENQSSLSPQTEKHYRTERPVVYAHPSSYSERNVDKTWSSQEWKSDELMENRNAETRCERTLLKTIRWILTRIRIVVGFQIILAQGEWSSAEEAKPILKRCNKRQRQTFCDMENVYVFYIASFCYSWRRISQTTGIPSKIQKISQWNRCSTSEKLITEQSDEIYGISTINWEDFSWKHLSLVNDEGVISLLHTEPWKDEREPTVKLCMGRQIDVVQKFIRIQNFGQNWWWANGIRVEYLPRIHHIAALQRSPRVTVKIECNTRQSYWTDYLHVDVQRDLIGIERQQKRMRVKCSTRLSLYAKRFGAGQWSFLGPGSEKSGTL